VPTSAGEPLLKIADLHTGYGKIGVLRGIDLTIGAGEVVALLGPNGAGKTTLLRAVSGLLPWSGAVHFNGRDLSGAGPREAAKAGLVHVIEGHRIFTQQTVYDNLLLAAYDLPRGERSARVEEALGYFPEIAEKRQERANQLSGGQQQMLAIARALLASPKLILMDEPSLGLSPKLTREIFDIVVRINRERGVTILLVEQNAHMALKIADFGYVLEVGRIVMEDTGARLAEKEDIREFYLGMKAGGVRGTRRWKRKKLWR
jgi:branched-chain amino acid transport system ATP-binding protein